MRAHLRREPEIGNARQVDHLELLSLAGMHSHHADRIGRLTLTLLFLLAPAAARILPQRKQHSKIVQERLHLFRDWRHRGRPRRAGYASYFTLLLRLLLAHSLLLRI